MSEYLPIQASSVIRDGNQHSGFEVLDNPGIFNSLKVTEMHRQRSPSCRIKVSISLTRLLFIFYAIVLLIFVYPALTHDGKILLSPPATLLSSSLCCACVLNIYFIQRVTLMYKALLLLIQVHWGKKKKKKYGCHNDKNALKTCIMLKSSPKKNPPNAPPRACMFIFSQSATEN